MNKASKETNKQALQIRLWLKLNLELLLGTYKKQNKKTW